MADERTESNPENWPAKPAIFSVPRPGPGWQADRISAGRLSGRNLWHTARRLKFWIWTATRRWVVSAQPRLGPAHGMGGRSHGLRVEGGLSQNDSNMWSMKIDPARESRWHACADYCKSGAIDTSAIRQWEASGLSEEGWQPDVYVAQAGKKRNQAEHAAAPHSG